MLTGVFTGVYLVAGNLIFIEGFLGFSERFCVLSEFWPRAEREHFSSPCMHAPSGLVFLVSSLFCTSSNTFSVTVQREILDVRAPLLDACERGVRSEQRS